jgi:AcrR family transcriptional regulator
MNHRSFLSKIKICSIGKTPVRVVPLISARLKFVAWQRRQNLVYETEQLMVAIKTTNPKTSNAVRLTREERALKTREQLFISAARVVGEFGYRDASIHRITADAGIAQGTFYLYFESRQALFDVLLPHFGLEMLTRVRERAHGAKGFFDVEAIGVRAVFEYLAENPWFWRVLNEAEIEAPVAWAQHHKEVTGRYMKFLKRAHADGEILGYDESELGTLVYLLIAARDYIYVYYLNRPKRSIGVPDSVIKTYIHFLKNGLGAGLGLAR